MSGQIEINGQFSKVDSQERLQSMHRAPFRDSFGGAEDSSPSYRVFL